MTLHQKIQAAKNHPAGFDYLRLALALAIICFHSVVTSSGFDAQSRLTASWVGLPILMLVPMFFSLSGFLVAGSLERARSLTVFLGLRGLRIFPALLVDTLFCALVIGPLLTTLPLAEYFSSPLLRDYFLNIIGVIHYHLPGLFADNPMDQVNGQLWTIPSELECYITLAVLSLVGLHRRRLAMFAVFTAATLALEVRYIQLDVGTVQVTRLLPLCFIAGVVLHQYRDRIRWHWGLFIGSVVLTAATVRSPLFAMLAALPVAYLTVFLGLFNPRRFKLLQSGDYSYGLFLYGFPLQQVLVATVPAAHTWYVNLLLAVPVAFAFSYLSWHLVEKRALTLKRYLVGAKTPARDPRFKNPA